MCSSHRKELWAHVATIGSIGRSHRCRRAPTAGPSSQRRIADRRRRRSSPRRRRRSEALARQSCVDVVRRQRCAVGDPDHVASAICPIRDDTERRRRDVSAAVSDRVPNRSRSATRCTRAECVGLATAASRRALEHALPALLQQLHHPPLRRDEGIDPRRLAVEVVGDGSLGWREADRASLSRAMPQHRGSGCASTARSRRAFIRVRPRAREHDRRDTESQSSASGREDEQQSVVGTHQLDRRPTARRCLPDVARRLGLRRRRCRPLATPIACSIASSRLSSEHRDDVTRRRRSIGRCRRRRSASTIARSGVSCPRCRSIAARRTRLSAYGQSLTPRPRPAAAGSRPPAP